MRQCGFARGLPEIYAHRRKPQQREAAGPEEPGCGLVPAGGFQRYRLGMLVSKGVGRSWPERTPS